MVFNVLGEFIKVNDFCIKNNQNYITKKIFSVTNENILPAGHGSLGFFDSIKEMSEDIEKHIKKMSYKGGEANLDVYPEMCIYFVTIMKVIRRCGDGKNAFSENIGQTWLSQDNIKAILEIKDVPVFILSHLIEFYYHIFLDIEKEITSYQ